MGFNELLKQAERMRQSINRDDLERQTSAESSPSPQASHLHTHRWHQIPCQLQPTFGVRSVSTTPKEVAEESKDNR